VAVDASADPGSWLLRILFAVDAARLVVAVGNNHPDLADAASQQALADLVAPKWALRFRRSTPGPASALVEAVAADNSADPGDQLVRHVLDRAHGRVANVWRDGLAAMSGVPKPEAASRVERALRTTADADATLMEIPRHRLTSLFTALRASAPAARAGSGAKGIN
jgi:hypothetical protein